MLKERTDIQSTSNVHPMDGRKNELRQILNVIPPGSNVYFIDIPVHSNGGDLLILKGTEAFFKEYGIHVRARYSVLDFPDSLLIPRDHIIVLHGGGNFGDLYPQHQRLREKIVAEYPHHRIVMMPQTIFYKRESEVDRTAQILGKHKDVHLYVRDMPSFKLASEKFGRTFVYLSPDMAHQLWRIRHAGSPTKELLCFLRTDIEKTKEQESLEAEGRGDYLDWSSLYGRWEQKSIKLIARLIQRGSPLPMYTIWAKYTDYLVNKAIKRFGSYRSVQTSRLHGHILSCLMDKPNTLFDNSYGKNSNYYQTWTSEIETANLVVEEQSPAKFKEGSA